MDPRNKTFLAAAASAASGVPAVTVRSWRHRYKLFPASRDEIGWNHFSLLEICQLRLIKKLADRGLDASDAISAANSDFSAKWTLLDVLEGTRPVEMGAPMLGVVFGPTGSPDDMTFDLQKMEVKTKAELIPQRLNILIWSDAGSVRELMDATNGVVILVDLLTVINDVGTSLLALKNLDAAVHGEIEQLLSNISNTFPPKSSGKDGKSK